MTDYRRPAAYQIRTVATCDMCSRQAEFDSYQTVDGESCHCGGRLRVTGESYPASSEDWDEERESVNGDWHQRRW